MSTATLVATPDEPAKTPAPYKPTVTECPSCRRCIGRQLAEDVRCPRRGGRSG
jgi:hypothetical protein